MSKVSEILRKQGRPFASFELVPPLKGSDSSKLYATIEPLLDFAPPFINITCHRDEVVFTPNGDGSYSRMTIARRPSTIAIVAAIMRKYKVDVVPHVICAGASKARIESDLLDLHFLGIDNVMALRGDAPQGQRHFVAEPDGYAHSAELVEAIRRLNKGEYMDPTVRDGVATDFSIGVAGYPEKHFEAANLSTDIAHLKAKVDAGADYIITQMFFDNSRFYEFVRLCREAGITVPIIPGLKPISSAKQIEMLPRSFHIDLPPLLTEEIKKATSPDAAYEIGTQWCIEQSRDLLAHGVRAIHFYTMSRTENVRRIVKAVF